MLSRLFKSGRDRDPSHDGGVAVAAAPAPPAPPAGVPARPAAATRGPTIIQPAVAVAEVELPPAAELIDVWRQDVARVCIELREAYPVGDAHRSHAERLLVKLAVDLEVVVRQPSHAAQEAFSVAGDPGCELGALVRLVERDPVLARGLLRHAASALYGGFGAPASVDDAVRRLGAQGVQVAVLAAMAEALLARAGTCNGPMPPLVWAHMVRTGPRARALARAFDVPPQEAFTLGLLHDVGKLVLFDLMAALREEVRADLLLPEGMASDALRRLHGPLGGLALLRWGVEPRAAWAVAHHHRDPAPEGHDRRGEVVFLAERLDLALTLGRPVTLDAWYAEGRLTAPRDRVEAAMEAAAA
jgi:HD-like signal output (HDOD) protein